MIGPDGCDLQPHSQMPLNCTFKNDTIPLQFNFLQQHIVYDKSL